MDEKPLAVLQMEIDTRRWCATDHNGDFEGSALESPSKYLRNIAKTAVCDTLRNGGTFVLVSRPGKVTLVQRADYDEALSSDEDPIVPEDAIGDVDDVQ